MSPDVLAGKTFDVEVLAGKTSGTGASSFPPTWGLGRRAGGDAKGEGGGSMRLCARETLGGFESFLTATINEAAKLRLRSFIEGKNSGAYRPAKGSLPKGS